MKWNFGLVRAISSAAGSKWRLILALACTMTLMVLQNHPALGAQADEPQIILIEVGPDQTLNYPNNPAAPQHLVDIPDEHTTLLPLTRDGNSYLVFGSSQIQTGSGGAVVLQTDDLTNFDFASALGYSEQVMSPPLNISTCFLPYNTEFDENYAGPGSVVQDPTLPPGNLIMIYEAENHCPVGTPPGSFQETFYGTVGFARSSDNGRTWPKPANGELGDAHRYPVLTDIDPEPPYHVPSKNMGDAIPSAFVDVNEWGEAYLYVTYGYYAGPDKPAPTDGLIRVARAKLGRASHGFSDDDSWGFTHSDADPDGRLQFHKWYNGGFSQPGIAGLDSGVLPTSGCSGNQERAEITRNDDLGLYVMVFVCNPSSDGHAAWYYSTATSLERQDWTIPRMIVNSERPLISPCNADNTGVSFDGYYPSFMSPGSPAGHTRLSGLVFFMDGCNTGVHVFASREFRITTSRGGH